MNESMQNNLSEEEPAAYFQRMYGLSRTVAIENESVYESIIRCGGSLNPDEYMELVGMSKKTTGERLYLSLIEFERAILDKLDHEPLLARLKNARGLIEKALFEEKRAKEEEGQAEYARGYKEGYGAGRKSTNPLA